MGPLTELALGDHGPRYSLTRSFASISLYVHRPFITRQLGIDFCCLFGCSDEFE